MNVTCMVSSVSTETEEQRQQRWQDFQKEIEELRAHHHHEVFLYGEDIVQWSLTKELEKIRNILREKKEKEEHERNATKEL